MIMNMKKSIIAFLMTIGIGISAMAADVATYPGGKEAMDKFIATTMQYPAPAKDNCVEGVVNVSFTVNPDGTIGAIKIMRMVDPDLEQEAIRIVKKMPAWVPAEKDGQAVESVVTVAIPFVLE